MDKFFIQPEGSNGVGFAHLKVPMESVSLISLAVSRVAFSSVAVSRVLISPVPSRAELSSLFASLLAAPSSVLAVSGAAFSSASSARGSSSSQVRATGLNLASTGRVGGAAGAAISCASEGEGV